MGNGRRLKRWLKNGKTRHEVVLWRNISHNSCTPTTTVPTVDAKSNPQKPHKKLKKSMDPFLLYLSPISFYVPNTLSIPYSFIILLFWSPRFFSEIVTIILPKTLFHFRFHYSYFWPYTKLSQRLTISNLLIKLKRKKKRIDNQKSCFLVNAPCMTFTLFPLSRRKPLPETDDKRKRTREAL